MNSNPCGMNCDKILHKIRNNNTPVHETITKARNQLNLLGNYQKFSLETIWTQVSNGVYETYLMSQFPVFNNLVMWTNFDWLELWIENWMVQRISNVERLLSQFPLAGVWLQKVRLVCYAGIKPESLIVYGLVPRFDHMVLYYRPYRMCVHGKNLWFNRGVVQEDTSVLWSVRKTVAIGVIKRFHYLVWVKPKIEMVCQKAQYNNLLMGLLQCQLQEFLN